MVWLKDMADVKTCPICFVSAKKTYVHLHYGILSCKSCKAFFRRIVQYDSSAKLKCVGDEKHCDMRREPKLKCKRCRYLQCLRVGLDPSRVLGVEERKKFTFPNKKKRQRTEGTEENEDATYGGLNEKKTFKIVFRFVTHLFWKYNPCTEGNAM